MQSPLVNLPLPSPHTSCSLVHKKSEHTYESSTRCGSLLVSVWSSSVSSHLGPLNTHADHQSSSPSLPVGICVSESGTQRSKSSKSSTAKSLATTSNANSTSWPTSLLVNYTRPQRAPRFPTLTFSAVPISVAPSSHSPSLAGSSVLVLLSFSELLSCHHSRAQLTSSVETAPFSSEPQV